MTGKERYLMHLRMITLSLPVSVAVGQGWAEKRQAFKRCRRPIYIFRISFFRQEPFDVLTSHETGSIKIAGHLAFVPMG